MKYLIIVESPNKIKTLENILKDQPDTFKVIATAGHIMDLSKKNMGVDLNTFTPSYEQLTTKKQLISNIKKTYKSFKPDVVLLAGDIDFEGTFINWSVKEILKLDNPRTLEFIAVTKDEVLKALNTITYINPNHLAAQQTRRILDRICGFSITNKLFKLYGGNVSAGRVQSVVAKLIVDKEKEINEWFNNNHDSYYKITCETEICNGHYINLKDIDFELFKGDYYIKDIKTQEKIVKPPKPFNTSSLQQKASSLFNIPVSIIMNILQSLFSKGLITYHRTTSIVLSNECLEMCKDYIIDKYGDEYYERREYKDKQSNSENSHEAIRHTTNNYNPKDLSNDELKIYQLIFNTTIQSQMKNKIINEQIISINNNKLSNDFIITNNITIFKGFDINNISKKEIKCNKGDKVNINKILFKQQYDNPPSRYSEASLINKLSPKNLNIGRPSTYASIINKIINRKYVEIRDIKGKEMKTINYELINDNVNKIDSTYFIGSENKKFVPCDLGNTIVEFMNTNFSNIMDYHFTSELEHKLDLIGEHQLIKNNVLKDFYDELKKGLDNIKPLTNKIVGSRDDKPITLKSGRYGMYIEWDGHNISCKGGSNYDELIDNYLNQETFTYNDTPITIKSGRYGKYFTYNKKNYSLKDVKEVSNESIKELIEKDNNNVIRKINNYEIINGPYGPYFKYYKKFISIPKTYDIDKLTLDNIKELIELNSNKKKKFYKKKI